MAATVIDSRERRPDAPSLLDRPITLGASTWTVSGWAAALLVGLTFRFAHLDVWTLAPDEARRSYDAWALQLGRPSLPGQSLNHTAPLFQLLQAAVFFLFGATDTVARLVPVLLGIAMIALPLWWRPFVGGPAALGMAALAAFSPTLVLGSRTATPETAVAFFSLLLIVAVLRAGLPDLDGAMARRWGIVGGVAGGALLASGPSSIPVLLSLAAGAVVGTMLDRGGALSQGLAALRATPGAILGALAALVVSLVLLFTRLLTDLPAISGLGSTIKDGASLIWDGSTGTPVQFFLLAIVLYEVLALGLALLAVIRGRINHAGGLGWPFFGGWFVTALVLWSLSAGHQPGHAVHVALPLVLLGGGVLGDVVGAIERRAQPGAQRTVVVATIAGLIIGLVAFVALAGRIDEGVARTNGLGNDLRTPEVLETIIVGVVVVLPLLYIAWTLISKNRSAPRGRQQPAILVILTVAAVLALVTVRSTTLLNFYNAGDGTELLAQRTMTDGVRPTVDRLRRLSRDATLLDGTIADPTGGHGLTIAAERAVQWPMQWYFRDFPGLTVVDDGQGSLASADVVMATDDAGMAEAGYTQRTIPFRNRVPGAYLSPDIGHIVGSILRPTAWSSSLRYLFFRDGPTHAEPETLAVGLDAELANRVFPATGPYALADRPGAGNGRGQFDQPIGIGVGANRTVYVVDQGNARVERFELGGDFIGSWGDSADAKVAFSSTDTGLGPTGLAIGQDGLIYVADTWNHRIVVLSPDGDQIREFGGNADTGDDPAMVDSDPGLFFGPRGVAVSGDEIYVTDTGNERVQVFGVDGAFNRTFGGFGSGPGQLIEPVGIALDADGLVYVADSGNARISIFTPAGDPVGQWPVDAWSGMSTAGGRPANQPYLAFGPDGKLFATSSETGSVEVFSDEGEHLDSITSAGDETLSQPIGITAANDGTIFVTDIGLNGVARIAGSGAAGSEPGRNANTETTGPPTSQPLPRPPGLT